MNYWNIESKRIVKSLLARKGVSHKALVAKLRRLGIEISEAGLANKLARGSFTFSFVLQIAAALEVRRFDFETTAPGISTVEE